MAKKRKSRKKTANKKIKANIAIPSQKKQNVPSSNIGWLLLIIGVLFLLKDLNFIRFWTIEWYTLVFLFTGLWLIKK